MPDYSVFKALKVEKNSGVALVTFNRPESMNAFDIELHRNVEDVLGALGDDDEAKAVVLTGAGRAFSAGGDVKMMKAAFADPSLRVSANSIYRIINIVLNFEKPLVAAVNGHAIGLGATLALFCDVVFISEKARIGDPHVNMGVVAGDGGCVIWPLLIGVSRAKRYLMTGDLLDAQEAERIGLVNKVVAQDQVVPEALAFAQRLASGPSKAVNWTKMAVNQYLKNGMNLILPASIATEMLSLHTADHAEAIDAFLEKRPPRFTGK